LETFSEQADFALEKKDVIKNSVSFFFGETEKRFPFFYPLLLHLLVEHSINY